MIQARAVKILPRQRATLRRGQNCGTRAWARATSAGQETPTRRILITRDTAPGRGQRHRPASIIQPQVFQMAGQRSRCWGAPFADLDCSRENGKLDLASPFFWIWGEHPMASGRVPRFPAAMQSRTPSPKQIIIPIQWNEVVVKTLEIRHQPAEAVIKHLWIMLKSDSPRPAGQQIVSKTGSPVEFPSCPGGRTD
jgi:hypothetical protein